MKLIIYKDCAAVETLKEHKKIPNRLRRTPNTWHTEFRSQFQSSIKSLLWTVYGFTATAMHTISVVKMWFPTGWLVCLCVAHMEAHARRAVVCAVPCCVGVTELYGLIFEPSLCHHYYFVFALRYLLSLEVCSFFSFFWLSALGDLY